MCGGSQVDDDDNSGSGKGKFGKPKEFNKNQGPIKNRSCTDIICCLLFLVCISAMVIISIVGYAYGDPKKLLYPTDSDGNQCGIGAYSSRPNLAYFDIMQCTKVGFAAIATGCPTPSICVADCPSQYHTYLEVIADYSKATDMLCKDSVSSDPLNDVTSPYNTYLKSTLIDTELCASYYVSSTALVGRCIPSIFVDGLNYAAQLQANGHKLETVDGESVTGDTLNTASQYLAKFYALQNYAELVFKDVLNSWWHILVGLGVGALFCFFWIVLLRWIAGIVVWITIALFLGCWIFACAWSYYRYYTMKNSETPAQEYNVAPLFSGEFEYYLQIRKTWLFFGCGSATVLVILLLIFLFLVKRICIAIELIKEASRAISNMIFVLIWPIIPFLLQIVFLCYYVASAAYVGSMGSKDFYNNGTNTTDNGGVSYYIKRAPCDENDANTGAACEFVKYGGDEYTIPLEIFLLFMFFWCMNFIVALGQMTLAGSIASYYFAYEKPKDIPAFPILGAFYRSIRYHLGSLAFGSLLIAIVQMIRVGLEYIDHKMKGSENCLAKFILKCLKCCMWCLEKFLRFLNKNAYILIAIHGKNFCASAKDAFFLIMRNIVRIVVLDKVTDFILFISKLCCVSAVGAASFFFFGGYINITYFSDYVPTLNYFFTPVILVIIGTFLIASLFFSVYSMAVDTLFMCFLEDLEMNDGSAEKPYYMSKGLMKVLGKKNKQLKEPEGVRVKSSNGKVKPKNEAANGKPQSKGNNTYSEKPKSAKPKSARKNTPVTVVEESEW
ncbi:choline transporter-like protein 2 [Mya arenaria]|uniref:choline transporter-like protein 2 n=1 Tax=Mya arenaria TaxID=6604 RepID=UPI0022E12E20|nr:choline transporter-like protein 2 [Mya arenaria]